MISLIASQRYRVGRLIFAAPWATHGPRLLIIGDCYESDLRPMSLMSQGVWGVYQAPHSSLVQDLALPREKMPERRKR